MTTGLKSSRVAFDNLIGGQWRPASERFENLNPSDTRDVIGLYAQADADAVDDAVAAAHLAAPLWAAVTPQARFEALDRIGDALLARNEELGARLAREEGKILSTGVAEVTRAGMIFKFYAGEALRVAGDHLASVRPGVTVDVSRPPIGVVGLITPWNFPIAIPAWKIAPALAYGNAVVFKPAELTPGCAWALAEIISRAPIPPGVFNLVMGGADAGARLAAHPKIAALSFTGSVGVGRAIAQANCGRLLKLQLEMGGKNPLIVLDDADLDRAVAVALDGAFFQQGQRCTASSRLIVTEGIHDRFVAALIERLGALQVGDALDPTSDLGPIVDQRQLDKDLHYIEIGRSEGAQLAFGGDAIVSEKPGFYLRPALFTETSNAMRINREEVFGPVASVIRARDYEDALAIANDTEFGLSAGLCTNSLKHASDFKARAQAGMVMINLPTAGVDFHVPFGGGKGSSFGSREQGRQAAEFYTSTKTSYTAP
jgi:aldehyde dehydrogenase (NAD+)